MAVKATADSRARGRAKPRKKSPLWLKWLKRGICLVLLVVLIGGSAAGFMVMFAIKKASLLMKDLPTKLEQIESPATVIYARDGKTLLYRASSEYRKLISSYDEIPKVVIDATLAAEDKRFFDHRGVDGRALMRAILTNAREGRQAQGASTITMQLSKRLFTSSEKSFQRKVEDAANAIELEKRLNKQQILVAYLNQIYYGQGAYGIKAAADVYFGKRDLKQLTAAEAALLARIVRRPSVENPVDNLDAAMKNRDVVLATMREEGMLTESAYAKALAEKPKLRSRQFGSGERIYFAPYFTRYIVDQLHRDYPGVDLGKEGWTVVTTLDPDLQLVAEKAVEELVQKYRRRRVTAGAFVLLDGEGQILAMQGNRNWERDQFNVIAQGKRQPGSSFKPFVYAAALSTGAIKPGDSISNEPFYLKDPVTGKVWAPKNSGGRSGGSSTIPQAIAQSRNLCAVHVTDTVTPKVAAAYCQDVFGFKSEIHPWPSMALGTNDVSPLEMAQGYSVFMLHGDRFTPYGVVQILDADKQVVRSVEPRFVRHILDEGVSAYMDMCLREVVQSGTGKSARGIRDARGKTGTTQDARDAWFCGYTNNLMGIGWIGNVQYDKQGVARYEPMSDSVFGGTVTVQMWAEVMRVAQRKRGYGVALKDAPLLRNDTLVEVEGAKKEPEPKPDPAIASPDGQADPALGNGTEQGTNPVGEGTAEPPNLDNVPTKTPETKPQSDPPRSIPPSEDTMDVEVCADSGQKATIYCPETVTRKFKKGEAPRRWCRKHSP